MAIRPGILLFAGKTLKAEQVSSEQQLKSIEEKGIDPNSAAKDGILKTQFQAGQNIQTKPLKSRSLAVSCAKNKPKTPGGLKRLDQLTSLTPDGDPEILIKIFNVNPDNAVNAYMQRVNKFDPSSEKDLKKAYSHYFKNMGDGKSGEVILQFVEDSELRQNLNEFSAKYDELVKKKKYDNKNINLKKQAQDDIAKLAYAHISETFPYCPHDLLTYQESKLKGKFIQLGEFIRHKSGVCRHRAALGFSMGNDVLKRKNKNIEMLPKSNGYHSWNYLIFNRNGLNNKQQVFNIDTVNEKIIAYPQGYIPKDLQ